jgi:hypothetical protein
MARSQHKILHDSRNRSNDPNSHLAFSFRKSVLPTMTVLERRRTKSAHNHFFSIEARMNIPFGLGI